MSTGPAEQLEKIVPREGAAAPDFLSEGILLVSCVDPERAHPSGRLAQAYSDVGVDVVTLFENARDPRAILRDVRTLWRLTGTTGYKSALINVNGSVAQLAAVAVLHLRGIPASLWIMDSYPGCLRYTTSAWVALWLPFYLCSLIVKSRVRAIFVIDEAFVSHAPTGKGIIARSHHTPLPIPGLPVPSPRDVASRPTIGIIGNIEQNWLRDEFEPFFDRVRPLGFRILIATSRPLEAPVKPSPDVELVVPWLKEDTDRVFEACDYLLVPISSARLVYSSPSKIVEAYSRGLQPVVMVDHRTWQANRTRLIYQRCLHLNDFLAGASPFSSDELRAFAGHWTQHSSETLRRTLEIAAD